MSKNSMLKVYLSSLSTKQKVAALVALRSLPADLRREVMFKVVKQQGVKRGRSPTLKNPGGPKKRQRTSYK
jgi:hypothetical protein